MKDQKTQTLKLPSGECFRVDKHTYDAVQQLIGAHLAKAAAEANAEIESLKKKICSLTRELNAAKQTKQVYNDLEPMIRYFRED